MRRVRVGRVERKEVARARRGGDERFGIVRRIRLVEFDAEDDAVERPKDIRRHERRAHWKLESLKLL